MATHGKIARAFLSLLLLLPAWRPAAGERPSSASLPAGASGFAAVRPFRQAVSRHLTRLNPPSTTTLSRLRRADLDEASAGLIARALAAGARADANQVKRDLQRLLGEEISVNLLSAVQGIHQRTPYDPAIKAELTAIEARLGDGDRSDLGAFVSRLDSLFSENLPSGTWLGGVPEELGIFSGWYILPNERNSHLFAPALKGKKGALVSVGTFRSLNDAALGDFSHVILLDHDHLTTAFNRANVDLIRDSRDRFEYLAEFFDRPPDQALMDSARLGLISDGVYLQKLLQSPRNPRGFEKLARSLAGLVRTYQRPAAFAVQQALAAANQADDYFLSAIARLALRPQSWQNSYFGSDTLFSKVKTKALEGGILAVNGDLAGRRTLAALGSSLRGRNIAVSALDLSNAPMYLRDWRQFIQNLQALPLAGDAAALFTIGQCYFDRDDFFRAASPRGPPDDGWAYFAAPAAKLLEGARADLSAFLSYAGGILQKADLQLLKTGLISHP